MGDRFEYRSDIDGLRALAVLSVVAFHYGYWRLPGGFVGVDIFFVISGYLITSQIWKSLQQGSFSLAQFYDRRMRRILPVMLVVIIACLVAGYALMIPPDYVRLANSAMAAAAGAANFYFFMHSGYFDAAGDTLPLLHLWSLGVEEQFYLVWPLILSALTYRSAHSKNRVIAVLMALVFVSFAASVVMVRSDPSQAFYMLPTRAWELALGGLVSFLPKMTSRLLSIAAGVAGLALIVLAISMLTAWSPFPGVNALAPCVGAALIVAPKARGDIVTRMLSLPPFGFVGKISFSLYLWHWPIFVFYKIHNLGQPPTHRESVALFLISLALSVLSYFLIERPFRRLRPKPERTVAAGMGAVVATFVLSSSVAMAGGLPDRFQPEALKYYAYEPAPMLSARYDVCFLTSKDGNDISRFDPTVCLARSPDKPNVLLIGDSHAAQFAEPLRKMFPDVNFSQVTASGCHPLVPFSGHQRCVQLMNRAFNEFLQNATFDDVVLSAGWGDDTGAAIRSTIDAIQPHARHITVFGPSLEYIVPMPLLLGKAAELHDPTLISKESIEETIARRSREMEAALAGSRAQFLSVLKAECDGDVCPGLTGNGTPMLFDRDHFTFEGATAVLKRLQDQGLFSWKNTHSS